MNTLKNTFSVCLMLMYATTNGNALDQGEIEKFYDDCNAVKNGQDIRILGKYWGDCSSDMKFCGDGKDCGGKSEFKQYIENMLNGGNNAGEFIGCEVAKDYDGYLAADCKFTLGNNAGCNVISNEMYYDQHGINKYYVGTPKYEKECYGYGYKPETPSLWANGPIRNILGYDGSYGYQHQTTKKPYGYQPQYGWDTTKKPTSAWNTPKPTMKWTTKNPTKKPTIKWTTEKPTNWPTPWPTNKPTNWPTPWPTYKPTGEPTQDPTEWPTEWPTQWPTNKPTSWPTEWPTNWPTNKPTPWPTHKPTAEPTQDPTPDPTPDPTTDPTSWPTPWPTNKPTNWPTPWPTKKPTTKAPTPWPTKWTTEAPTQWPTKKWTTEKPTKEWTTKKPTMKPTMKWTTKKPTMKWTTKKPTMKWTTTTTQKPWETTEQYHLNCDYRQCPYGYECVDDPRCNKYKGDCSKICISEDY